VHILLRSAAALPVVVLLLTGPVDAAPGGSVSLTGLSTAAAARMVPVLGSKHYEPGPYDRGFGTAHPKRVFNGGDPSGLITHITWKHWGSTRADGWGKNAIFKPGGGYYRKLVRIQLRAKDLGHCSPHSHLAYQRLRYREPRRPGGPLGKWHSWSGRSRIC
jgi:hypothetical protein